MSKYYLAFCHIFIGTPSGRKALEKRHETLHFSSVEKKKGNSAITNIPIDFFFLAFSLCFENRVFACQTPFIFLDNIFLAITNKLPAIIGRSPRVAGQAVLLQLGQFLFLFHPHFYCNSLTHRNLLDRSQTHASLL